MFHEIFYGVRSKAMSPLDCEAKYGAVVASTCVPCCLTAGLHAESTAWVVQSQTDHPRMSNVISAGRSLELNPILAVNCPSGILHSCTSTSQ